MNPAELVNMAILTSFSQMQASSIHAVNKNKFLTKYRLKIVFNILCCTVDKEFI